VTCRITRFLLGAVEEEGKKRGEKGKKGGNGDHLPHHVIKSSFLFRQKKKKKGKGPTFPLFSLPDTGTGGKKRENPGPSSSIPPLGGVNSRTPRGPEREKEGRKKKRKKKKKMLPTVAQKKKKNKGGSENHPITRTPFSTVIGKKEDITNNLLLI